MFDIGFSELLVIGVVALLVIGPERLPKVARMAGAWMGRLNRYVSDVKQDIDREMQLDELRKMQQQMKDTAQKYEILAEESAQEIRQEAAQAEKLMQAMSVTDGGLAMREYEKLRDEQAAGEETPAEQEPIASTPEPHIADGASPAPEAEQVQMTLPGLDDAAKRHS